MAASIGGSMMQARAQERSQRAQNAAISESNREQLSLQEQGYQRQRQLRQAEQENQDKNLDRAGKSFGETLSGFGPEKQKQALDQAVATRSQVDSDAVTGSGPGVPVTGDQPQVVVDAVAKGKSESLMRGKADAARLGAASAMPTVRLADAYALNRGAEGQASLQDQRRASGRLYNANAQRVAQNGAQYAGNLQSVLPLSQAAAGQAGKGLHTFGDLLKGAGQIGSFAAASGVGGKLSDLFNPPIPGVGGMPSWPGV